MNGTTANSFRRAYYAYYAFSPRLTHVPVTAGRLTTNSFTKPGGSELTACGSNADKRTNNNKHDVDFMTVIVVTVCKRYRQIGKFVRCSKNKL